MPRCSSTNKFEGMDDTEVEVDSEEISDDGAISIELTINRLCNGCGQTVKYYSDLLELTFSHTCEDAAGWVAWVVDHEGEEQFSLDSVDAEETSRAFMVMNRGNWTRWTRPRWRGWWAMPSIQ